MTILECLMGALICGALALAFHRGSRTPKADYQRGYQDGHACGYEQGRLHADNWWLEMEKDVIQEREKIWKEGK